MANTCMTREELEGLRRSDLRSLAVSDEFGMTPKEAVAAASKDLIDFIIKTQEAKQGAEATKPGKKATKLAVVPDEEPAPEVEEAPVVEEKVTKTSKKEENAVVTRIDKLGLTVDAMEKSLKSDIVDTQRQVYVLMAMLKLFLGTTDLEPADVDAEITKANSDFDEVK